MSKFNQYRQSEVFKDDLLEFDRHVENTYEMNKPIHNILKFH